MASEFLTAPVSTYCPPALEDAWRQFGDYDKNAYLAQKRFINQRRWIIGLGVAITTLVVFDIVLENSLLIPDHWFAALFAGAIESLGLDFESTIEWVDRGLNFIIILIPIVISILVAGAVKFNMGVNWVMLRSGAESIKREIYRYRTQVDAYNPQNPKGVDAVKGETRDVVLARKIKHISKRIMETQVNMSELEVYDYKKEGLPPAFGVASGDDGFSNMTADQYLHWRIEDQFEYYRRKAKRLAKELQRFQWMIYIFGGLGTLLAAIEFEIWVAITSALVSALSSFLEFKRVETNLIACNLASSDLYDIRTWWRALPEQAKQNPANLEALVKNAEAVIQSENASWLVEMREALSEVYGDAEGDVDAEGDRRPSRVPAYPGQTDRGSEIASSTSSTFGSMIRGENGNWLSDLQGQLKGDPATSGNGNSGPTDTSGDASPDEDFLAEDTPSLENGHSEAEEDFLAPVEETTEPGSTQDWLDTPLPSGASSDVPAAAHDFEAPDLEVPSDPDLAEPYILDAGGKITAAGAIAFQHLDDVAEFNILQAEEAETEPLPLESLPLDSVQLEAPHLESIELEAAQLEAAQLEAAQLEAAQLEAAQLQTVEAAAADEQVEGSGEYAIYPGEAVELTDDPAMGLPIDYEEDLKAVSEDFLNETKIGDDFVAPFNPDLEEATELHAVAFPSGQTDAALQPELTESFGSEPVEFLEQMDDALQASETDAVESEMSDLDAPVEMPEPFIRELEGESEGEAESSSTGDDANNPTQNWV